MRSKTKGLKPFDERVVEDVTAPYCDDGAVSRVRDCRLSCLIASIALPALYGAFCFASTIGGK